MICSNIVFRLTQLLADQAAPPAPSSPLSHREAQLKLKALNQATVKLASKLEQREAENKRLKRQLEKVLYMGSIREFEFRSYIIESIVE